MQSFGLQSELQSEWVSECDNVNKPLENVTFGTSLLPHLSNISFTRLVLSAVFIELTEAGFTYSRLQARAATVFSSGNV